MSTLLNTVTNALRLLLGVAALSFVAAMPVSLDLATQAFHQLFAL